MTKLSEYLIDMIQNLNPEVADTLKNNVFSDKLLEEAMMDSTVSAAPSENVLVAAFKNVKASILKLANAIGVKLKSFDLQVVKKAGQSTIAWVVAGLFLIVRTIIDFFKYIIKKLIDLATRPRLLTLGINVLALLMTITLLPVSVLGMTPTAILSAKVPALTALSALDNDTMWSYISKIFVSIGQNVMTSFNELKGELSSNAQFSDWLVFGSIAVAAIAGWITWSIPIWVSVITITRSLFSFDINKFISKVEEKITEGKKRIDLYLEIFNNASQLVKNKIEISGRRELIGLSILVDNLKSVHTSAVAAEKLAKKEY